MISKSDQDIDCLGGDCLFIRFLLLTDIYLELISETAKLTEEVTYPPSPLDSVDTDFLIPLFLEFCLHTLIVPLFVYWITTLALTKYTYFFQLNFRTLLEPQEMSLWSNFKELWTRWSFAFFHILNTTKHRSYEHELKSRYIIALSDLGLKIRSSFYWQLFSHHFWHFLWIDPCLWKERMLSFCW